jgi:hypothetical protein
MTSIFFGIFDWTIIIAYFAFIVWTGIYFKKFTRTDNGFLSILN